MDAYLNCNQCGKCCNTGPSLAFSEVFKFQDKFVIGLYCQAQAESKSSFPETIMGSQTTDDDHKLIMDHMGNMFGRMNTLDGNFYLQFYPMDIGYSSLKHHSCDQLQADGGCGIHADKPSMCRSVPFDAMFPESQQALTIEVFMSSHSCLTTTGQEQDLIYRDGQIVSDAYKKGYDAKLHDLQENIDYMMAMAKSAVDHAGFIPPAEHIIDVSKRRGRLEVPIVYYLGLYIHQKPQEIGERAQQVIDFCASQIALANELITKAISRKNKAELERTRALRKNIDLLKIMSSGAFEILAESEV